MKIISITGTKGKTTITRALSYVIHHSGDNVLRVDTDGHYINEKQRSTLIDSKNLFSLVPTVCPGKYLLDVRKQAADFTAVFETAIGCSGGAGLGYGLHQIGIFSNVLEDHLGASKRLRTRLDIAKAKDFIFSKIDVGGTAVFNGDDKLVCSQLNKIPAFRKIQLLPIGFNFKYFDIEKHLQEGGKIITPVDGYIAIKSAKKIERIIKIADIKWTFDGNFKPSVYNLMLIIGGLYAHNKHAVTKDNILALKKYSLDKLGGRLTLFENKNGVKILLDYAHERFSLGEVAKLGKSISKNKTIGVVRLAPDRTDKMLFETGQFIANRYDSLIVYDKIDGVNRKEYKGKKSNINRKTGEVSDIFFKGVLSKKHNGFSERILEEKNAIKKASEIAERGDVVIVICGDDHKKTVSYIKKYFKAYFI